MPFPIRFSWEKLSVYCWRDPTLNNFTRSIACPLGANEAKIGSGILLSEEWSEKGGCGGACGKTPESNPLMSILWSCFSGSSFLLLQSFKCLTSEEIATLSLPLSLTFPNCGLENASSVNHNRPWDHGYKAKLKQLKKKNWLRKNFAFSCLVVRLLEWIIIMRVGICIYLVCLLCFFIQWPSFATTW